MELSVKKYWIFLATWISSVAEAANNASAVKVAPAMPGSSLNGMVFSLFAIIIVMLGIYWGARRFLMQRLGIRRVESMKVISITMLGPKEKVVVLDTREGETLVLGVTSHQITLLDKRRLEE